MNSSAAAFVPRGSTTHPSQPSTLTFRYAPASVCCGGAELPEHITSALALSLRPSELSSTPRLQSCLPSALWTQLAEDFNDDTVVTNRQSSTPPTIADCLKRVGSVPSTRAPFAVRWLSGTLEHVGGVLTAASIASVETHDDDAAQLVNTLSRIVVGLHGITATLGARCLTTTCTHQCQDSTSHAFLLLALSFLHWFQRALCEAQAAQRAQRRRRKRAPRKAKTKAPGAPDMGESAALRLKRLLLTHATQLTHPARYFERALTTCVVAPLPATTRAATTAGQSQRAMGPTRALPVSARTAVVCAAATRRSRPLTQRRPRRAPSYSPTTTSESESDESSDGSDDDETTEAAAQQTSIKRHETSNAPLKAKKVGRKAPPPSIKRAAPTPVKPKTKTMAAGKTRAKTD